MILNLSGLKIYNSSAGSGKTYSLIKEYLLILFYNENMYTFQHILIITFTNKVVKEIKLNILNKLNQLSKGIESDLFFFICNKLNKSSSEIKLKAKNILKNIIHNYGMFSVYTIDKFYFKIINNINFNENIKIELYTNNFLKKSVKILLKNLDKSDFYSKLLIDFSLNEMKEGKTWNPYNYLLNISKLLIKEENIFFIEKLKIFSIKDYIITNNIINKKIINIKNKLNKESLFFFKELKKKDILYKSFYRSLLPFFFKKISKKFLFSDIKTLLNKELDEIILTNKIYAKKIDPIQKRLIDFNLKKIRYFYIKSKKYIYKYMLYILIKKNLLDILTLYKLYQILNKLKKKENILFNIDVYNIIYNKNYIYENIGSRYNHYFIDEFQDTSILQWCNIKPLIENTLSENGTVLIAGDIKQSIYRWRGSDIDQFLQLIDLKSNNYKKEIKSSSINYRSYKEIVKFNNFLYSSIKKNFYNNKYKNIYNIKQKFYKKNEGYIELNFLKSKNNYINIVYPKIKKKILSYLEQGYKAMEIAILVRKNEEGFILSELFNYDGISVINSDYMLLKNFWQIKCIIGLFRIISSPYDSRLRINWILYLKSINKIKYDEINFHNSLSELSLVSIELFFKKLSIYEIYFDKNPYLILSILTLTEEIIKVIKLNEETSIIILNFFLDFILNNIEESGNSISIFLKIWDLKKNNEFILLSENIDAIKIMTIHKSKGLEFPIVFIPFLYWQIFKEKDFFTWINMYPDILNKINTDLKIKYYIIDIIINSIKNNYKNIDKNNIDDINLLYVSTTRAIEQLIIFTVDSKKNNIISYFLKNFLINENIYQKDKITYTFGKYKRKKIILKKENKNFYIYNNKHYLYSSYKKNYLFINKNINILSNDLKYKSLIMIRYISNINIILKKIYNKYYYNNIDSFNELKKNILLIINNINLNIFFKEKYEIRFECEIFYKNLILKINRLIFFDKKIIIINYITNGSYELHISNTKNSIKALLNMGYENIKAYIINVNDTINIINLN